MRKSSIVVVVIVTFLILTPIQSSAEGTKVYDDTGQRIGTLVGVPSTSNESCQVFVPQLGKFAELNPSGLIVTGVLVYNSSDCSGTPYFDNINHHWLVAIFNGVDYTFYTGGAYLGLSLLENPSVRRPDGSCDQLNPFSINSFEVVEIPSSKVPFELPFVPPYHYK